MLFRSPPVPPPPEATAELDVLPPQAGAALEVAPASAELEAPPEAPHGSRLPFDVEHLGPLRRAVLDALVDADEPLNVSRIFAEMPAGTTRGSAESAIKREFDAGRIERVAAGTYRIAKPKPPEAKPASPPPPSTPEDEAIWFEALQRWVVDRSSWDVEKLGPPPDARDNLIPPDIRMRFNDRQRKRIERQRDREAAVAKQAEADRELRNRLLGVCRGNFMAGRGLDDLAPVRAMLQVVRLDDVLIGLKRVVDRRLDPRAAPIASWKDERFLEAVARHYALDVLIPSMVAAWTAAGRALAPKTQSSPPAGHTPDDIDNLRSHHDSEHAPPGPHSLRKPPMDDDADAAPDVPMR